MNAIDTTICPGCNEEHPAEVSHRLAGRYVCSEGQTAGGPHRFVMVTDDLTIMAEADSIDDAATGAAFLSAEQGRPIYPMEYATLAERKRIIGELTAKRERLGDLLAVMEVSSHANRHGVALQIDQLTDLIDGLARIEA